MTIAIVMRMSFIRVHLEMENFIVGDYMLYYIYDDVLRRYF